MFLKRLLFLSVYGILILTTSEAAKAVRTKLKIATTSTTTAIPETEDVDSKSIIDKIEVSVPNDVNVTTRRTLTGIPQIDYVWDPNLPRELNGFDLSEYPFYNSVPPDIDFMCDGLHDGFYASVQHKCQVYHHCLFGTRYDFLCANFTAFDQRTFICHFASEVDCVNSKKYWHRNDALYQAATTTTSSTTPMPTTTTTTTTSVPTTSKPTYTTVINQVTVDSMEGSRPYRRRRPFRRRPTYDYYNEYYDDEYEQPIIRNNDEGRNNHEYEDRTYIQRDRYHIHDRNRDSQNRNNVRNNRERDSVWTELSRDKDSKFMSPGERLRNQNTRKEHFRPTKDSSRAEVGNGYQEKRNHNNGNRPFISNSDLPVKSATSSLPGFTRPRIASKIRRPIASTGQDGISYRPFHLLSASGAPKQTSESDSLALINDDDDEDDVDEIKVRRPTRLRRPIPDNEHVYRDESRSTRDQERDQHYR